MAHIEGVKGNKTNRLGVVLFANDLIYGMSRNKYSIAFQDIVILDIDYYDDQTTKFICESRHFDEVPMHDRIPSYVLVLESTFERTGIERYSNA